jgi:predicted transcriptional regulator
MLTKEKIIETIKAMPEERFADIDSVIEEIILLDKIEKGLDAVKKGEVLSEEDIDREIEKW